MHATLQAVCGNSARASNVELQSFAMTSLPHQFHPTFINFTVYSQCPSLHYEHNMHAYACANTVLEALNPPAIALLWRTPSWCKLCACGSPFRSLVMRFPWAVCFEHSVRSVVQAARKPKFDSSACAGRLQAGGRAGRRRLPGPWPGRRRSQRRRAPRRRWRAIGVPHSTCSTCSGCFNADPFHTDQKLLLLTKHRFRLMTRPAPGATR